MGSTRDKGWCVRYLIVAVIGLQVTLAAAEDRSGERRAKSTLRNEVDRPAGSQLAAGERLFLEQVQPLLKKRCFGCHGEGKQLESQLDLRSRKGMLKGGDNGAAIVPGKPQDSPIYLAVLRTGDFIMPPKDANRLTAEEIVALKSWISAGAPWVSTRSKLTKIEKDERQTGAVVVRTSGGLTSDWTDRKYEKQDIWAYQPVKRYPVPLKGLDRAKINNPIDAFVQARLKKSGLTVTGPADKLQLIRRATINLTGLPPTRASISKFLTDKSGNAFGKVIARLLKSKRYGEQMARHWLDVVRYADTSGFANDYERPNAWRYRDYVIRSFNNDKPFDRFILEQIVGDEIESSDPELLIAAGFLRMGPWEHTGMSVAAVTRQQYLDDVTNSVGVTFLGQGLRCAKCHDHKFDPIPTRDYYRNQAVFASVQFADREVPYQQKTLENTSGFETGKQRTVARLKEARQVLASLRKKNQDALAAFLKKRGVTSVKDLPIAERGNSRFIGLTAIEKSLNKIYSKRKDYYERELNRFQPLAFSV